MDALNQKSEIRLADKLWKFHWDCGRAGDLYGVFIATEEPLEGARRRFAANLYQPKLDDPYPQYSYFESRYRW